VVSHLELTDINDFEYIKEDTVCDLTVEGTHNYYLDCGKNILVHNSGKTYALCQHLILKCVNEWAGQKKTITISRKTFPALRGSVMRDFFEIIDNLNLYKKENYNKSTSEYTLGGNLIEFVSVDQPQKVRGRKRDICWLNEANEFEYDDFFQFNIRTTGQVFFDYNPSDEYHWIYEKIIPKDDCIFIQSSFMDNPFLEDTLKGEILKLKDEDENLWKIYGLGEKGSAKDLIYTNWDTVNDFPPVCEHYRYGLDFGYNHPSSLLLVGIRENDIYVRQIIYQTHLTNQDLIDLMKEREVSKSILVRADSAEPDRIKEIASAGYKITAARKSKSLNKDAIDNIKRRKIHITKDSPDVIKEIKGYRWKKDAKTGEVLDEPIKYKDDAMDTLKYSIGDIIIDKSLFTKAMNGQYDKRRDLPRRAVGHFSLQ